VVINGCIKQQVLQKSKGYYMKQKFGKDESIKVIGSGEHVFNNIMNVFGILITVLALYPLYYVFIASFSKPYYVENGDVMFRIIGFTLDSYKQAFAKNSIWIAYGNTIFYTVFGVLFNMFFTATMAYALSKTRLLARKWLTIFVVFTMWFSAGIIPLYMTFRDYHLLNTRFAVLGGFALNTYNLIILKSFFEQVPSSLEEAAFIGDTIDCVVKRIFRMNDKMSRLIDDEHGIFPTGIMFHQQRLQFINLDIRCKNTDRSAFFDKRRTHRDHRDVAYAVHINIGKRGFVIPYRNRIPWPLCRNKVCGRLPIGRIDVYAVFKPCIDIE